MTITRRSFLRSAAGLFVASAAAPVVEPVRRIWQVGRDAPVREHEHTRVQLVNAWDAVKRRWPDGPIGSIDIQLCEAFDRKDDDALGRLLQKVRDASAVEPPRTGTRLSMMMEHEREASAAVAEDFQRAHDEVGAELARLLRDQPGEWRRDDPFPETQTFDILDMRGRTVVRDVTRQQIEQVVGEDAAAKMWRERIDMRERVEARGRRIGKSAELQRIERDLGAEGELTAEHNVTAETYGMWAAGTCPTCRNALSATGHCRTCERKDDRRRVHGNMCGPAAFRKG